MQGKIIQPVGVSARDAAVMREMDVREKCFKIVAETETPWVKQVLIRALAAVGVA